MVSGHTSEEHALIGDRHCSVWGQAPNGGAPAFAHPIWRAGPAHHWEPVSLVSPNGACLHLVIYWFGRHFI